MSPERFQDLLLNISDHIFKEDTKMRKAIPPGERLALTLRFLATGDAQQSLSYSYRIGKTTVSRIISETCDAIYTCLKDPYLKAPQTKDEWINIAKGFEETWNMPHAIGAIDGKHIRIECPKLSGTQYFNYKGFYSIVLLAICDANYCFTLFDVGQFGSNNDSGVLANSRIGDLFEYNYLNVPEEEILNESYPTALPYFLLGDEIFPLKQWLMRPFPGRDLDESKRIYNYRHSRARRTIENAFGILTARWRIFLKPIRSSVENVEKYVLACLALHNYLRLTENASYTPTGFVDSENNSGDIHPGDWRNVDRNSFCFGNIRPVHASRYSNSAAQARENLKSYFVSEEGSLSWQWDYIRRTSH